jgi:hypothetical protein
MRLSRKAVACTVEMSDVGAQTCQSQPLAINQIQSGLDRHWSPAFPPQTFYEFALALHFDYLA